MQRNRMALTAALLLAGLSPAWAEGTAAMPGMDHGTMNHAMPGGSAGPGGADQAPPAEPRDPHAYAEGTPPGPLPPMRMGDEERFGALMIDRLEAVHSDGETAAAYDLQASYGGDYDRAVLKAEGELGAGGQGAGQTELLWSHAVAPFWDAQAGLRYDHGDHGDGGGRGWLAVGVQGLAPYWFELDATAYLGEGGATALQLAAEYDLRLTQRWILQPRVEATLYGQGDASRQQGAGLSDLTTGVRLRYEIEREFAPYLGLEWAGRFGETADRVRAAGGDARETRIVAGVRLWF